MKRPGKSRKGTGSIVGAVFILLIILSSYSINQLNARMQYTYQGAMTKANQVDIDRKSEALHIYNVWEDGLHNLAFGVINRGSVPVNVKYIGVFDTSVSPEKHDYYNHSLQVKPYENVTSATTIPIDSEKTYLIQIITERGNVFDEALPYIPESTIVNNNTYILNNGTLVEEIIRDMYNDRMVQAFGSLGIDYDSFHWARRNPSDQTSGFTWSTNRDVDKDYYVVWRLNITNLGTDTYIINDDTCISFMIDGWFGTIMMMDFYIVYNSGTYSDPTITSYGGGNTITLGPSQKATLYFAVNGDGDNPSSSSNSVRLSQSGECTGILKIFDSNENYGQSIATIAVRST